MNANELADEVVSINDAIESEYNRFKELDQAATMLRQQQAEIEALTIKLSSVFSCKGKSKMQGFNYSKIIKDDLDNEAPVYTNPADLTDEEIRDLAGYAGENPSMDDMIEFARAILRKAQEK